MKYTHTYYYYCRHSYFVKNTRVQGSSFAADNGRYKTERNILLRRTGHGRYSFLFSAPYAYFAQTREKRNQ